MAWSWPIAAAMLLASWSATGQESIVRAEELIRLQSIPLSRPVPFETMYSAEQMDYLAWMAMRVIDPSHAWNPKTRGWSLYRANVRYSVDLALRQRVASAAGIVRSLAQNPDTALAKFYADGLTLGELQEAIAFFGSDAGKKFTRYLTELSRAYFVGLLELNRIAIDPELQTLGDSVAERRVAWLRKRNISLEPPPVGYDFHLRNARQRFPVSKSEDLLHALFVGAPPGTEVFQRLDQIVPAAEREQLQRYLRSAAADKERQARAAWSSVISKSKDVLPLLVGDAQAVLDVVPRWKRVRADPGALPRSIARIEPGSIEVLDEYKLLDLQDAAMPAAMKACLPGVSDDTIRRMTESTGGRSYRETSRTISMANAPSVYLARQGMGACVPVTVPGFAVPAINSFVGTVRVIGMDQEEERRWYRAVAQEIAADGASESLIVAPNGNAFEITYATNLQQAGSLIYVSRLLFAGTYDVTRYRTVHRVPELKSVSIAGQSGKDGLVRHEKLLLSTAEDIRRDRERRSGQPANK